METAVLTEYDMKHCVGSSRDQICHEMIAIEVGHGSCFPALSLFFKGNLNVLKVCAKEQLQLTVTEKPENLGYGVWLITSGAAAYILFESYIESMTSSGIVKFSGCNICIITLKCGKQLVGPHI